MKMAWSYSRLSMFEKCPLLFQHTHILKTIPFVKNKAMERGTEIHKELERNVIRELHGQGHVGRPETLAVSPIIKAFVSRHPAVNVEQDLAFKEDLDPCSWFDKATWLRCKIDLSGVVNPLSKEPDHLASVIDFKTGQYRVDNDQLRLYNLSLMYSNFMLSRVTSALLFVDQKKSSPPITLERRDLKAELNEFTDRSEAINIAVERSTWPAMKNFQCKWCSVNTCQYVTR